MSINVSQAFKRTSIAPIDETLALTKAQMVATVDTLMPAYYFTICQDDGEIYLYDKSASATSTTGKFTKFTGGGGSSDVKFFDTTDTLNPEINGTKNVVAGDLPGVDWDDLVVGSSVIKDAKGTLGLVTAINGSANVTVATATTSTPTRELTQAEYDALTEAEKNNGTIYFITDNYVGSTYVGAYDTIYSTTEHIVGSYMGKPLYQKTYYKASLSNNAWNINVGTISSLDELVELKGVVKDSTVNLYYELNSTYPSDTLVMGLVTSDGRIDVYCARQNDTWVDCYVTVRYTKTTDITSPVEYASPNDYSTSEKIVGSWIDGKPIYQKVIDVSSVVLATNQWVDTSISFTCETIIYSKAVWVSRQPSGSVTYQGQSVDVRCTSAGKLSLFTPYGNVNPDYIIVQYTKVS